MTNIRTTPAILENIAGVTFYHIKLAKRPSLYIARQPTLVKNHKIGSSNWKTLKIYNRKLVNAQKNPGLFRDGASILLYSNVCKDPDHGEIHQH